MNQIFEATIGLEVHIQLNTKSKIFCSCPNGYFDAPNKAIDVICCGYPGTLPVLNKEVIGKSIMLGIALNCEINKKSKFDRKHYFYPDSPKGYQITQQKHPILLNGDITLKNGKKIRIHHIHLEEDAGKNLHIGNHSTYTDFNRAGSPLLEMVTCPDMTSSEEVKEFLKKFHSIITALNISSGDMESGALRVDGNVSIKEKSGQILGTKCEIKNVNSFKFLGDAIDFEIGRQSALLQKGEKIIQQTRSWDTKKGETFLIRDKEMVGDYRYLPEPDLPSIIITEEQIEEIRKNMPLLPDQVIKNLIDDYNISLYEAEILYNDPDLCEYFRETYKIHQSNTTIQWILREIIMASKELKTSPLTLPFTPTHLAEMIIFLDEKKISQKIAQNIIKECMKSGEMPKKYIERTGFFMVEINDDQLRVIIKRVIESLPQAIAEYKKGKIKIKGVFVGKVLAETKGNGDPKKIEAIVEEELASS